MNDQQLEKPKKKLHKKWWAILIAIIIIGGAYYWFGYRVSEIRKDCNFNAIRQAVKLKNPAASGLTQLLGYDYLQEDYDKVYQACLRAYGLNK